MEFGISTWTPEITERIISAITAKNILARDAIVEYHGDIDDLLENPPNIKFVCVAPMNLPLNIPQSAGGGDQWAAFDGTFRVDICMQVMEREHRSKRILSESNAMLPVLVKQVLTALHVKPIPLANGTQSPLRQPMRLMAAVYNPRKPAPGWAYCRTTWQTFFRTDLRA